MQHSTFKRVQKIALKFTVSTIQFHDSGVKIHCNKPFYIFSIKIKEYRDTAVIHVDNMSVELQNTGIPLGQNSSEVAGGGKDRSKITIALTYLSENKKSGISYGCLYNHATKITPSGNYHNGSVNGRAEGKTHLKVTSTQLLVTKMLQRNGFKLHFTLLVTQGLKKGSF